MALFLYEDRYFQFIFIYYWIKDLIIEIIILILPPTNWRRKLISNLLGYEQICKTWYLCESYFLTRWYLYLKAHYFQTLIYSNRILFWSSHSSNWNSFLHDDKKQVRSLMKAILMCLWNRQTRFSSKLVGYIHHYHISKKISVE